MHILMGWGCSLRFYRSIKLPGALHAAGVRTTPEVASKSQNQPDDSWMGARWGARVGGHSGLFIWQLYRGKKHLIVLSRVPGKIWGDVGSIEDVSL